MQDALETLLLRPHSTSKPNKQVNNFTGVTWENPLFQSGKAHSLPLTRTLSSWLSLGQQAVHPLNDEDDSELLPEVQDVPQPVPSSKQGSRTSVYSVPSSEDGDFVKAPEALVESAMYLLRAQVLSVPPRQVIACCNYS